MTFRSENGKRNMAAKLALLKSAGSGGRCCKYGNKKVEVEGVTFASKREANRWALLLLWEKAGKITGLQRQVKFELIPGAYVAGRNRPSIRYFADFVYYDFEGNRHVEDSKGAKTDVYKLKRHLMKALLNIDIEEV